MHFLLTGGSGFVGGNLARVLVERGHTVTALVRKTSNRTGLEKLGVRFAVADLRNGDGLDEALVGVDVVEHVAGVTKARTEAEYVAGNADGTRKLCEAMARMKTPPRLVFCSSLAAAGPAAVGQPREELQAEAPVSMYGRSKLAAELVVRQFADRIPSVILRPPIVYGPGDTVNLPPLMAMGRLGVYLKAGLGPRHFSFIHVDDLVEALYRAATEGKTLSAQKPSEGIYFVTDPVQYTWQEFCTALSHAMGKRKPRVISLPARVGHWVGMGNEIIGRIRGDVPILSRDKALEMTFEAWTCSGALAEKDFAFKATHGLESGLRHSIKWYRAEGLL